MFAQDDRFTGFESADFDVFEESKQRSNRFNMDRMRVRDRLNAIGVVANSLMPTNRAFRMDVSAHMPTIFNGKRVDEMVLFITRPEEQQRRIAPILDRQVALPDQIADAAEHHRNAFLGVRVNHAGVQVGLLLHSRAWLDVMNLLSRARDANEAKAFVDLCLRAGPSAKVVLGPGHSVAADQIRERDLSVLEDAILEDAFMIFVGWDFPAGNKAISEASFALSAAKKIVDLLPMWDFVAWRPTSNYLATADESSSHVPSVSSDGTLVEFAIGDNVKLTGGVFAGRTGSIQDIDRKGKIKVMVGKVSVRIESRLIARP